MKHWLGRVLKSLKWKGEGGGGGSVYAALVMAAAAAAAPSTEMYSISDLSDLLRPIFRDNLIGVS